MPNTDTKQQKEYTVIGLMSGTSLDGIDAAILKTDGYNHLEPLGFLTLPYDDVLRNEIRLCLGKKDKTPETTRKIENKITLKHVDIVQALIEKENLKAQDIDLIGFHGQTIYHNPSLQKSVQLGNGSLLAEKTNIPVIYDFRRADMESGGEGAPFLPLYHRARISSCAVEKPCLILNIGGVSNITWIGENEDILAFDTGPGNALMDDLIYQRTGQRYDESGILASKGSVNGHVLNILTDTAYFEKNPPKSLDRDEWDLNLFQNLNTEDALATLANLTVFCISKGLEHLPIKPENCFVTGGGRYNDFLMKELSQKLDIPVSPVEFLGWNGDLLEAEGFAYLAVRSLLGEPLSLPKTTGVPYPQTGGILVRPS